MHELDYMERVAYAYARALQSTDSTVWVNRRVPTDARIKWEQCNDMGCAPALFGVKDTSQISRAMVDRLAKDPRFVWMSVDRMAPHGRAIDPELVNPLTGRRMTGSTSGGPVNILRGIHDLAIGTDGGGSILGPAIATQLVGINGKGLGLVGGQPSRSTEGYPLTVGIGAISHTFALARDAIEVLLGRSLAKGSDGLRIALDEAAPRGALSALNQHFAKVEPFSKEGSFQRETGIKMLEALFEHNDVVVSYEGPVDVDAYCDSLAMGQHLDERGGKFLLRSANILNATAVAIPDEHPARGFVVMAPEGYQHACGAFTVAERLATQFSRTALFEDYFMHRTRVEHSGFFHLEV
ncbi:amidase family protein [Alicyclobacillus fastidiosus]|uniref:Amidase family protein n=1 Tax=Alicyclobacillus fastidiosus TaxID=392011 RepID=A0ABV5AGF7_9BACL|nr:amidase family protein [Alicyclobacillus fastidiosus]WEH08986.1 amidase family protein [Alicyclobacillus fastidiosus]